MVEQGGPQEEPVGKLRPVEGEVIGGAFAAVDNQVGAGFQDGTDLLLDVTGGPGTIDSGDFLP